MAKQKKQAPEVNQDAAAEAAGTETVSASTAASETVQVDLFPEEKLYTLKLGSVDVPVVEDGKGYFKSVTQGSWNLDHQRALLDYWRGQAAENKGFNIGAKMAKLFVMPEPSE